ncbi:MAG: ParA family protein [Propionibacteriaceae bacterium]|jgi:chromosome partitioning protein|nr:ParA family protein [Propionibacteriaceae bacterium]
MTWTVAVGNAAGSAGKSTSVVALAALLGLAGRKVVVLDADAQASATVGLGVEPSECRVTVGDVLLRRATLTEALVETVVPGVRLVPASRGLDGHVQQLTGQRAAEQRLRLALIDVDADIVLIDCPGSMSVVTVAALVAADVAVTVAFPTSKEIDGIAEFMSLVKEVAEAYGEMECAAVIPCAVPARNRGGLYVAAMALLDAEGQAWSGLLTPQVRQSVKVPEAFANRLPLPVAFPQEAVTADYRLVLDDLRRRGVLPSGEEVCRES